MAARSPSRPRGTASQVHQLNETPTVPSPLAHHWEVEAFLIKYFEVTARMTEAEAKVMSSKMRLNGAKLYEQHETTLITLYGPYGTSLFNDIHNPTYGRFCNIWPLSTFICKVTAAITAIVCGGLFWESARGAWIAGSAAISITCHVIFYCLFKYCSRANYIKSPHAEWSKGRVFGNTAGIRFRPGVET